MTKRISETLICDHKFSHRDPQIAAFKGSYNLTVLHPHIKRVVWHYEDNLTFLLQQHNRPKIELNDCCLTQKADT